MTKITVVANNISGAKASSLKSSRGLSFFVSENNQNLLFDTGSSGEELLYNLSALNINPKEINRIAISHNHWDHTGGLVDILNENKNNIEVYFPKVVKGVSSEIQRSSRRVVLVEKREAIIDKIIYSSGLIGLRIKEQALCINSKRGFIVLTGCAHPGVVAIVKKVKKDFNRDIYAAFGGFHMEAHPPFIIKALIRALKNLGVEKVGPSHCTGDSAIRLFKEVYKDNFVELSLGDSFILDHEK